MAVVALLLAGSGYAQTEISYSQIIKNPVWINPAVQGLHKGVSLDLAYRRQWDGFEGAPKTIGFNVNNSFDKIHLGVGVDGHFEEIGLRKNRRFGINLNTEVRLTQGSFLMFGLSGGMDLRRYKSFGEATAEDDFSQYRSEYERESFVGGFGLAYRWKGLLVGASGNITVLKKDDVSNMTAAYVHARYRFDLGKHWMVSPMALYSYNNYFEEYEEIGVLGGYTEWIEAGVSYRFNRWVSVMVDIKIADFLSIGYNYNINTGDTSDISNGSHEFGLRFAFNKKGK